VAGFCEHGNKHSVSIKKADCCLTRWVTISFSNNILHHGVGWYELGSVPIHFEGKVSFASTRRSISVHWWRGGKDIRILNISTHLSFNQNINFRLRYRIQHKTEDSCTVLIPYRCSETRFSYSPTAAQQSKVPQVMWKHFKWNTWNYVNFVIKLRHFSIKMCCGDNLKICSVKIDLQFNLFMGWICNTRGWGYMRSAYKILVGKPEGKRPLGWRRRRWEDSIRMDLREIGWEVVNWMHLAQDMDQ